MTNSFQNSWEPTAAYLALATYAYGSMGAVWLLVSAALVTLLHPQTIDAIKTYGVCPKK